MSMYQNMAQFQALSSGIHPHFGGLSARKAQGVYVSTQHPDIDADLNDAGSCDLSSLGEVIDIEGHEITVMSLDTYRYVVYDKQIQHIRNTESFLNYHKKNTGSLEHLMTNLVWAQLLSDSQLENMYMGGHNQDHARLRYPTSQWSTKEVPLKPLLEKTQRWLQGIIIEAHGAQGFEIIKRSKEKAADKLKIDAEKEHDLYMTGSGAGFELNQPVILDTVEAVMSTFGDISGGIFSPAHSGAYGLLAKQFSGMLAGKVMGIPKDVNAYVKPIKALVMHGDVPNQNRTKFPADMLKNGVHTFIDSKMSTEDVEYILKKNR